jgi:diaminobutyrate-2-oxoglutarate transaminase
MVLEAVQGEGGVIPAPDGWLRRMRTATRRHDIPLIVDEVQTGVGRTGAMWAHEHTGIVPDVLVASKAIGGGLPLAVVLYRDDLDVWAPGAHAGTFRGNALAMAAGAATLRFVAANDLPARAEVLGGKLLAGLSALADEHPAIGDVRGRGLMLGVELVQSAAHADHLGARPAAPELARQVRVECLLRGLIVELGGRHDAVLRLLPPLTITEEQADSVLERLADALRAAARSVG